MVTSPVQPSAQTSPLVVAARSTEPDARREAAVPRPVQLAAWRALGQCGSIAVPALRAALDEPQPWVQKQIAAALADAEKTGE